MNIKEFMEVHWKKIKIKKWEYLYNHNENDTNLYFIVEGEILLTINWIDIALVGKNEINWEKSFINNSPKPIDAKIIKDAVFLVITQDIFSNLNSEDKIKLLKQLTLFISERVYLLNEVINNISNLWEKISHNKINLSTLSIWDIFSNLIKIKNIYVYKKITWWIIPLYESNINSDFIEENKKNIKNNKVIQLDNKYIVNTCNYIFIFEGSKLKKDYIINNVFIHTINNLEYLWLLIENKKNEVLEWYLGEEL